MNYKSDIKNKIKKYTDSIYQFRIVAFVCVFGLSIAGCSVDPDYPTQNKGIAVFDNLQTMPENLTVGSQYSFVLEVVNNDTNEPVVLDSTYVYEEFNSDYSPASDALHIKLTNNATAIRIWGTPQGDGKMDVVIVASPKNKGLKAASIDFEAYADYPN